MDYKREHKSHCCLADTIGLDEVAVVGVGLLSQHYTHKCTKCGKFCHEIMTRAWDSNGVEIKSGDLLECPDTIGGERYHICCPDQCASGGIEIRDLGNNNLDMYLCHPITVNLGPHSKNKDIFTSNGYIYEDEIRSYFGDIG